MASSLLIVAGATSWTTAASAEFVDVPPTGTPGRLVLAADPYPAQFLGLSPGDESYWQIRATLEDAESATLALQFTKDGQLVTHPRGLTMAISRCGVPWRLDGGAVCAIGGRTVARSGPADPGGLSPTFDLEDLASGTPTYLLVELGVADSPGAAADASLMGLRGDIGIGLTATAIDGVPTGPTPPPSAGSPPSTGALPDTGGSLGVLWGILAMALGALGVGVSLRTLPRGSGAGRDET